ncbi:PTS sugar transporter subunit IIA [Oenococcus oeni]|uniref:PTS sugar transporter subunit IIA n=4 Tax=Oenococcus oeni TaxID=1247 RepID=A0A6H3GS15_OENOE|nr:PTS sugar transporter subunit IIA [Oenococcus oeni]KGO15775.1 PTS sugar transporter subunit IIA [Oenococcus oeni X2L]EJO02242.1 phosphotransferase system, mannose/fructose-specific component IIA [Oenococcus oeni AWRIB418]KEP88116.1 PTS sugar transporter subunit IIA [Oenococcus oeni IOEB_0501]KGH56354.1 PTS sugar transporter subunit IIA [Oenococcus oeni S22]KGH59116.1 PTS sugar transporter subunit IIA [Oenococcus oeni IOEB_9805]
MKLILVSHGPLSSAILESAEMIVGKIKGAVALSLTPNMSPSELQQKIEAEIKKIPDDEQIVVALDLLGGTPANVTTRILAAYPRINVLTGMNLPMAIEFANQQLLGGKLNFSQLLSMGQGGIVDIKQQLQSSDEDEDEV